MDKKGDIKLNSSELISLRNKIAETYKQIDPDFDTEKFWRTNPANYERLSLAIKEKTTKIVSQRFLSSCLFLSPAKKSQSSFRATNIDALYLFAYGNSRNDTLNLYAKNINDLRRHTLYYLASELDEAKIFSKVMENIGSLHFEALDVKNRNKVITSSLLANAFDDNNEVVHIYINRDYLESKLGMQDLIEILSKNLQRSFFDSNIRFYFDSELFGPSGLLTTVGFKNLEIYWEERLQKTKENFQKLNLEVVKKEFEEYDVIRTNLNAVCLALKEIHYQDPGPLKNTNQFNIDTYIPYLSNIKKLSERPLQEIYKKAIKKNGNNTLFLYLCVIAYNRFFDVTEKDLKNRLDRQKMLNYFKEFNTSLKTESHKIIRLFTIPGKFSKRKGWQSALKYNENLNLFSYCYLNALTADISLVLLYDPSKENREVLAKLDYVIRIETTNEILNEFKPENIWLDKFVPDFNKANNELYIAYPPAIDGTAQMIVMNEPDDIKRYYQDFRSRISYLFNERDIAFRCLCLTSEQLTQQTALFNLPPEDEQLIELIKGIDMYSKQEPDK